MMIDSSQERCLGEWGGGDPFGFKYVKIYFKTSRLREFARLVYNCRLLYSCVLTFWNEVRPT